MRQDTITFGEVYSIKLNSGEELIAKVMSIIDNILWVEAPHSVAPGPHGMGLVPSMFTAEPGIQVQINISSISLYAPTEENIRLKYLEATTGIQIPQKKILVG